MPPTLALLGFAADVAAESSVLQENCPPRRTVYRRQK
jgi:hypothetical protein